MKETTQQRASRIAHDDAAAFSQMYHAEDFFNGLATYEISKSSIKGYLVYQRTPRGQRCGSADTVEQAEAMIEEWKNETVCCGYSRKQLMGY